MHTNAQNEKTLKSYTIVPQNLYVSRQADRQLSKILVDKGRPGYVLVSRQMGKTNLLLNARRVFQSISNHFVYLDISNNFPDLSSFLRNIIDVAIDSLPAKSVTLRNHITHTRSEGTFSSYPHKEHEQELRYLLSEIQGNLIICLDEIDSIIKTNYSDSVFSFIRSIYFSGRVNFSEFERLTYILSGVAEPTELIKDKASSPFNIGEKIYLDDFSYEEFKQFISNAQINIDKESQDRIFYWTNGNPRLTWDICSKIEDLALDNALITPSNIDEIVKINYLSSFDLPPIDHIRVLAEEDAEVRASLIAIHYGKGETLSDQQKSKLYLSGIISSSINSEVPEIKNRIIAEALTEAWLKEVDISKLSILERANKFYESKQFADAALLFEEYIASIADASIVDPLTLHKLGSSYYELSRFDEAASTLSKKPFTEENLELFLIQHYWRAMCHFFSDDLDQSKLLFNVVINKSKEFNNLKYYYDACVNLTSALVKGENTSYEEISALTKEALETPEKTIVATSQKSLPNVKNLFSVANINLFKSAISDGLEDIARSHIAKAIDYADILSKVGLIIELLESKVSLKLETEILDEAISYIYENSLPVLKHSLKYPNAFDYDKASKIISHLYRLSELSKVRDFVSYLTDEKLDHEESIFDILFTTCTEFITKGRTHDFLDLSKITFALPQELLRGAQYKMLLGVRILFDDANASIITKYDYLYVESFWVVGEEFDHELQDIDYKILDLLINKFRINSKYQEGLNLINKFKTFKANDLIITDENPLSVTKNIVVTAAEILISRPLFDNETIFLKLIKLSELFKLKYSNELLYFSKQSIDSIKGFNDRLIQNYLKTKTIRNESPKYGRNQIISVRFKDGKIAKGKYKNLKDKINDGECVVVE